MASNCWREDTSAKRCWTAFGAQNEREMEGISVIQQSRFLLVIME